MKKFVAILLCILFFIPIVGCDEPEPEPELLPSICLVDEYVKDTKTNETTINRSKYILTPEEPSIEITIPYDGYRRSYIYRVVDDKGVQINRGWNGNIWKQNNDKRYDDIGVYMTEIGYYHIVFGDVIHPSNTKEYQQYYARIFVHVV